MYLVHQDDLDCVLLWKPINELPGYPDQSLDKESDEYFDQAFDFGIMPGIVLRHKNGSYTIVGHESCGNRTSGCGCCSVEWLERLDDYDAWAYLVGTD